MGSKVERFERFRFERFNVGLDMAAGFRMPVWSMLDAKWMMSVGLRSFRRVIVMVLI